MSTWDLSWVKGGRCVRLTTVKKLRALIYPEPLGPPRPVAGGLYLLQRLSMTVHLLPSERIENAIDSGIGLT